MSDDKRRVAVMGTAPSSIPDAPLDDPEWEVWGTSRLWKMIPRQDVWFELHDLDQIGRGWDCTEKERRDQRAEHMEWLADADIPVYLQATDERIPNGRRYPLEEIIETLRERFGDTSQYFTNTISYMLAYALYCDVDEVGIWGVDMALDEEYMRQRPSVEYWIGLLRGAGIPVTVPASCDLLQTAHLYGYEHEESKRFLERLQAREKELGGRKDQTENQIQKLAQVRAGALTTADYFDEFLSNGYKIPDPMQRDMSELVQTARAEGKQAEAEIEQLKRKAEHLSGAKSDVEYIRRTFVGGA